MKSSLYTGGGDAGNTSLVGGTRTGKDDARLEAYGTLDELNSHIGLVAASPVLDDADRATLHSIQRSIFDAGTILATEPASQWQPQPMSEQAIAALEAEIDRLDTQLPRHKRFILPGGHPDSSRAHVARTVARRAERRIVALMHSGVAVDGRVLRYVNRLSDYLFALARTINMRSGTEELFW